MERNIFAVISVFIAFLALGVTMVWLLQHDPLEQALKGKESQSQSPCTMFTMANG